ncbi:MAG: molybdopterin-binding protein [Paracoccaceae bacterium]
MTLKPPPLRNDCFALPAGVDWTPVEDALALLKTRLRPVTAVEEVSIENAVGRILARSIVAARSNPPHANTAVDGYGFAGGKAEGEFVLPLVKTRAAAGPMTGEAVPEGSAIRILTGAALPIGVDTVILEEDVNFGSDEIAFRGPLKQGANARQAGEDFCAGDEILGEGRRLTPADLALTAAAGLATLPVFQTLRVGVLSTGDELVEVGDQAEPGQIFDANRPMLLSLIARLGHRPIDLGRVADKKNVLRARLDSAAAEVDLIITSGGASAGDEDHVSALLKESGALQMWRLALKPGRPLALGIWQETPVFGLPGNPVAALVCALVFASPAMGCLAGQGWVEPQVFELPSGFEKRKKPGRREYLRARVRNGRVEVFNSEGSGRISGLSWAEGLVEIGDDAAHIKPGDPVRYLPFSGFGF